MTRDSNVDVAVVRGFGDEWTRFDQSSLVGNEYARLFNAYFDIFPWDRLPANAIGFDAGCGSGRWARTVAPRVRKLHCIDASAEALAVARRNLALHVNCEFHQANVAEIPVADDSMDFGYSLGVLHHVPDTEAAVMSCVRKLKSGAPFLLYLYYAFDGRPLWFRALWRMSDIARRFISREPRPFRYAAADTIAVAFYWPLARIARFLDRRGIRIATLPLSAYRDASFYTMRTDALDRFGTRIEHRFTRVQIESMMRGAGLTDIRFSDHEPFWCAVGIKS